ncbi:inositol monophosphatase family protein [Massilia sp. W12]|uniref:inositol monophosphatase family protein n=1 Tax=Massilia sp. W12 TaxID=3126507 RepID=UPI0030CDF006
MLNTAVKAARRAGAIINRASFDLDRLQVSEKNPNDFVTEIDKAAEQAIIEILLKAYPDHAILGEESGPSANLHDESPFVWIIDPLDGTTNFLHGFPQYCVSIALQHNGVITQGVIYDPNRNDLFTATKGAGAYLNDKRLRVNRRDKISQALISTGIGPGDAKTMDEFVKMYRLMLEKTQGLRREGSAALDLAWVACGRLDGFFEKGLKVWDMAAGALMVQEAGGIVGDFTGEAEHLQKGNVIAASPKIYAQMVGLLSPYA